MVNLLVYVLYTNETRTLETRSQVHLRMSEKPIYIICLCIYIYVGSIIRNILVYILYRNETRALETRSTGYNIEGGSNIKPKRNQEQTPRPWNAVPLENE